jgi:hypothetical protein
MPRQPRQPRLRKTEIVLKKFSSFEHSAMVIKVLKNNNIVRWQLPGTRFEEF